MRHDTMSTPTTPNGLQPLPVEAALDRMDAMLDPACGLLAVPPGSMTYAASVADMRTIREALRAQAAAPAPTDGYLEQHHRDSKELRRLCAARDVARRERDHARACYESTVTLLLGIHALLYPITVPDGRVIVSRPNDPDPHVVLQELSDRIRALPDSLSSLPQPQWAAA